MTLSWIVEHNPELNIILIEQKKVEHPNVPCNNIDNNNNQKNNINEDYNNNIYFTPKLTN